MKQLLLVYVSVAMVTFCGGNVSVAQCVFNVTSEQSASLMLSEFEQSMQQLKVGRISLPVDSAFVADGMQTTAVEFNAHVAGVVSTIGSRDIVANNPLPDQLGPFWDFQISEPVFEFNADTCLVTCTFLLFANGARQSTGHILLIANGRGYRIAEFNGLLSLLDTELATLRRSTSRNAENGR